MLETNLRCSTNTSPLFRATQSRPLQIHALTATTPQTAHALAISHATAERHWDYARSWLRVQIGGIDQTT